MKNSPFKDRSQRRTSDPLSQAKVDVSRSNDASFHGTPRSVKNRKTTRSKDEARSKTFSEFDTSSLAADGRTITKDSIGISRVSEDEDEPNSQTDETSSSSWTIRLRTARTNSGGSESKSVSSISSSKTETRSQSEANDRSNANGIAEKSPTTNGHSDNSIASTKSENQTDEERSKVSQYIYFSGVRIGQ